MSANKIKSGKRRRSILVILVIILGSIGVCSSGLILKAVSDRSDYGRIIYGTDHYLLQRTAVTRYYHDLAWRHVNDLNSVFDHMTPTELMRAGTTFDMWMPNMRALLNGKGYTVVITAEQVNALNEILLLVARLGSPSLHDDIIQEMDRLHLPDFIGMTMTQAWVHLHALWGNPDPPSPMDYNFSLNPTDDPTPGPFSIRTPGATLEGGDYSSSWATYRDPDDNYGFAYPIDWVLKSQPDVVNTNQVAKICNNNFEPYYLGNNSGTCIFVMEFAGIDPEFTLFQAISGIYCPPQNDNLCTIKAQYSATASRPARLEFQRNGGPDMTDFMVVFRDPPGKLIVFFSELTMMQSLEAQAMVDSFVFGNDTPIIAPSFEPSKRIDATETNP